MLPQYVFAGIEQTVPYSVRGVEELGILSYETS